MHVLFITYHFPPSAAVGAQRPSKMVDALLHAGHTVTVVARAENGADSTAVDFGGRLHVHRVVPWRGVGDLYLAAKRRVVTGTQRTSASQVRDGSNSSSAEAEPLAPWWRRFARGVSQFPDGHRGFIWPALRPARAAIASGASVLITTAPPWSAHLVGLLLKTTTGIRWIADYRDPWTGSLDDPTVRHLVKPASMRTGPTDALEAWLERRCLASADQILCATQGIAAFTSTKIGRQRERDIHVVLNGIDARAPAQARSPDDGGVRIVHAGNCYVGRDPIPFLEAFANLASRGSEGCDGARVEFVGACREFKGRDVAAFAASRGLADCVRFSDWMPKLEADRLLGDADLLLLLAQDQPICVPNKLYDYLATGRPILAFTSGETASMLTRIGGHTVVTTSDALEVERALARALAQTRQRVASDRAILQAWSTTAQMQRFIAIVEAQA